MKYLFLFTFFICTAAVLHAQSNYRFIGYNVSNGLSQNSVHCIYQDSDGMLWLGTQDGLNSFDGRNFKHYKYNAADSTTISDQFVLTIAEDAKGLLWVGTRSGLNKFNKRTGKFQRIYLNERERNIMGSAYAHLTASTKKEILVPRAAASSVINTNGELLRIDSTISSILLPEYDKQGRLWGFAKNSYLYNAVINNIAVQLAKVSAPPEAVDFSRYKCVTGDDDIIWCYQPGISNSNIYFFNAATKQWLPQVVTVAAPVNHLMVSKNGTGWLSTLTGLYKVNSKKTLEKINAADGFSNQLPAGNILCTYEDRQHNIWAGSANGGFAYYNPEFDNYNLLTATTAAEAVTAVAVADSNTQWLGSAGGLYLLQKNTNGVFVTVQTLFGGRRITACVTDRQNNVWVAVQNEGLYVLSSSGSIIKTYRQDDSTLQTKNILYMLCDSKGRVHVCTEKGFFIFTALDKWINRYKAPKDFTRGGYYVLHCYEDNKKNIWYSKHIGIEVLDENLQHKFAISSADNTAPIKRTIITGCTQDDKGNIWIATLSNGLYQYNNGSLVQYSTTNGLSSNVIYGVVSDDKGRLWATTTSGINVYVPDENRFYILNSKDGLPADDYVLGALFKNTDGQLQVGSSKGLITINTGNIVLQNKKAVAQIADVKLNGESVAALTQPLLIAPGNNTVSFDFSIQEALQPKNIFYQYRVKGLDNNWTLLQSDNHSITYTNLPYKKLTMQVRAAYAIQDLTNAPIEEFTIVMQPPFWKTNSFMLLVALVAAAILYLVIRQINQQRKRKREQLAQVQKELQLERERISRDLHDNIGAYTSALVAGINRLKISDEKNDEITELGEYAGSIMGYLRETIWVLNNEHLTLLAFTDRFKNYATRIIKNYPGLSVSFNITIEKEKELSPQQSLNLFRIMQEALQNACKHAGASAIAIEVKAIEKIKITIADNGIGLTQKASGDNYGLQNMQQRAAEINFALQLFSENGTTVVLHEK
jgi:ligand-binding sensor domain-containing protein